MTAEKKRQKLNWSELIGNLRIFGGMDILFLLFVLAILSFGLIMQFSASYPYAYYSMNDPMYFFRRQAFFAALGIVAMLVFSRINYDAWRKIYKIVLAVTVALLLVVFVLPQVKPGFYRWINLGFTTFQPSEIAKFTLILVSAVIFDAYHNEMFSNKMSRGRFAKTVDYKFRRYIKESAFPTVAVVMLTGIFAVLIYLEHHLSGAIIIFLIGCVMMFLGGVRDRWFIIGIVGVVGVAAFVCYVIMATRESGSSNLLQKYMGERIIAWLDKDYDPTGSRWQTNQSLYAIGSGGFFGVGLGASTQKYMYVSEPQNDFIFAIVCEETGFFGAFILLLLFALLVWRGIVIGVTARTRFGGLLAMGIVLQVGIQVVLNIAVATDSIPNTGISLPFFSYGGTSLVIFMVQMGIVLSVSRTSRCKKIFNG